jgi:hypothetical protein
MAVTLHRCSVTFLKTEGHGCWRVEKALQDTGVDYRRVTRLGLPRNRRKDLLALTGQTLMPVIVFEDGSAYRAESAEMAAEIRAGKLFEHSRSGQPAAPVVAAGGGAEAPSAE